MAKSSRSTSAWFRDAVPADVHREGRDHSLPRDGRRRGTGGGMNQSRRQGLAIAAVAVLGIGAACTRPRAATLPACDPEAPAVPLSAARSDSLRPLGADAYQTIDERSADIARRAPGGYAGIFVEQGRTVVLLADTSNRFATLAAVLPMVADAYGGRAVQAESVQVRKARWNFAQLYDWGRYLDEHVWSTGGVTMRDLDEFANRVTYGVADDAARRRVESRLAGLGVPCGLVVVQVRAGIKIR